MHTEDAKNQPPSIDQTSHEVGDLLLFLFQMESPQHRKLSLTNASPSSDSEPLFDTERQHRVHRTAAPLTAVSSLRWFITSSRINILLVFFPLGIIASALNWSPGVTFCLNFFAIVPLAKMLGTATEEIAIKTGDVVGGLLNATFGNAVELIISIAALREGKLN
jgi:Ca2+:H+ antiporter